MRLLIADPECQLSRDLLALLRGEGHDVTADLPARELPALVRSGGMHLAVADPVELSWADVLALCRQCAAADTDLFLVSRRGAAEQRAEALLAGAKDYLAKPYAPAELTARVRVRLHELQRRSSPPPFAEPEWIAVTEHCRLDVPRQVLSGPHGRVPLGGREFRLLRYLLAHAGKVVSREELLLAAWGPDYAGATREVDRYIRALRLKVEASPDHPRCLLTRHGVGYYYAPPLPGPAPRSAQR